MRTQGFHHLAIQVRDLEGAVRFYSSVLGLPEIQRHLREDGTARSIWLSLPGGGFLALEQASGAPLDQPFRTEKPGLHLLALRIDPTDRFSVVAELEAKGVPIVHQTRWTLYVQDPEGNRIGLSHHPTEPSTVS